jgi:hypothetical protein
VRLELTWTAAKGTSAAFESDQTGVWIIGRRGAKGSTADLPAAININMIITSMIIKYNNPEVCPSLEVARVPSALREFPLRMGSPQCTLTFFALSVMIFLNNKVSIPGFD